MRNRSARGKNLSDDDILWIVRMLDGWSEKLTWSELVDAVEKRTKIHYCRQALSRHARIQSAFEVRKKALKNERPKHTSKLPEELTSLEVAKLVERLARASAENDRLRFENDQLLEQFVVWAYNAHTKNLSKELLNRPLPRIDREATKKPVNKSTGKRQATVTKIRSATSNAKRGGSPKASH